MGISKPFTWSTETAKNVLPVAPSIKLFFLAEIQYARKDSEMPWNGIAAANPLPMQISLFVILTMPTGARTHINTLFAGTTRVGAIVLCVDGCRNLSPK